MTEGSPLNSILSHRWGLPRGRISKDFACSDVMQETQAQSLGWEDPLKEGMATGQYSCLGNPLDRGAWRAIVHEVTRVGHDLLTKQQQEQQVIRLRYRFLSGRVTNNSVQWE